MSINSRQIEQSPIYHGEDEGEPYFLTIPTTWATNPTVPVVTIYDSSGTDVTSTTTAGTTTATGQVITLCKITGVQYRVRNSLSAGGITAGKKYLLVVRFTTATGEKSCFGDLVGQK